MKLKIIALLAACAMVTVGCSTPPAQSPSSDAAPPQEVDRNTTYTVSVANNVVLSFDADGNVVEQENGAGWVTLNDVLTGEALYKTHTKTEDTGANDKGSNPIVSTTTALYTLDGKLLYGYSNYTYDSGVGGLLIRKHHSDSWVPPEAMPKDYKSGLWNPATGETVQPNIATLHVLDKDKGLLAAMDASDTLLGTVDANGSMIKSIDKAYRASAVGNRIVVANKTWGDYSLSKETYTLLDKELTPLASADYISVDGHGTDKLMFAYSDKGFIGMMDASGNKMFAMSSGKAQYVNYCDGEMAIMAQADGELLLMKADGTVLGEPYDNIVPICNDKYNLVELPMQFAASRGNIVYIIDRQGTVIRSATIDGFGGIFSATAKHIVYGSDANKNRSGLLDLGLNVVLVPDKYDNLYQHRDYGGNNPYGIVTDLMVGQYYPHNNPKSGSSDYRIEHYDIYNSDMEPIADSLTRIGTVGKGRIAVVRGFSAGVIDWQGNWVGKTSIFQTASDERRGDYF